MGDAPYGINKPTGSVLCYPVISGVDHPHIGSFKRLLGNENPSEEELRSFSLELNVTEDTVPSFIWHTFEDKTVPVENAIAYARALRAKNIPFELHIYPEGPHGLSLANKWTSEGKETRENPVVAEWVDRAAAWAEEQCKKIKGE
jgi:dipeptidyl aminopeptidase/acylaminoacyl peptidase